MANGSARTGGGLSEERLAVEELPDKETAEERRAASLSAHLTTLVSSGVEAREATVGPDWRGDNVRLALWAATRAARWRRPAISARQSSKASQSKERSSVREPYEEGRGGF